MSYFVKKASNKFNAKRTEYNGRWYHSKGEAAYAEELDWMKKSGDIQDWKPQHKIELKVNGHFICNYYVDFKVTGNHGEIQYHEYKGAVTQDWQIKWELFHAIKEEIDPGCELILVKHNPKWVSKPKWNSKSRK